VPRECDTGFLLEWQQSLQELHVMRAILSLIVTLLLLAACGGGGGGNGSGASIPAPTATDERPNFVVVILDDWGWRDYGAKDPQVNTPNIDFIAQDGFAFENAFLTTSSCSPSRASILMSRYPTATGAPHLHDEVPPGFSSIPEALGERGYYTAAMGKWHLGKRSATDFSRCLLAVPGVWTASGHAC